MKWVKLIDNRKEVIYIQISNISYVNEKSLTIIVNSVGDSGSGVINIDERSMNAVMTEVNMSLYFSSR